VCDDSPGEGPAFLSEYATSVCFFCFCVAAHRLMRSREDAARPDCSWLTFGVQLLYLSLVSNTALIFFKAIHAITMALRGPFDSTTSERYRDAMLAEQLVLSTACFVLLASTIPNQRPPPPAKLAAWKGALITLQELLVAKTWAFSAVGFAWWLCFEYLGKETSELAGHLAFYGALLLAVGLAAALAASTPKHDFAAAGSWWKRPLAAMIHWYIDICVIKCWHKVVVEADRGSSEELPEVGKTLERS